MENKGVINLLDKYSYETMLDLNELAKEFKVCTKTIQRRVVRYQLPDGIKHGNKRYWSVGSIISWYKRREDDAIRKAEKRLKRIQRYEEVC